MPYQGIPWERNRLEALVASSNAVTRWPHPSGDDGDMGTEILAMIGDYCCISLAYAFCVKYERFQV